MSNDNVIPFRPKAPEKPSEGEMSAYRDWTKNWSPEMRQVIFPQYACYDDRP